MSEEDQTRAGLIAIGCPPDIAAHIAGMDRREDEIRERLLRLAKIPGLVAISKMST